MRSLPRFLSFWAFLIFPFLFLCAAEPGAGGGSGDPGGAAGGTPADNKTSAGAGNGGQPGAAAVEVQAAIRDALAKQEADFTAKLKAATGHDSFDAVAEAEARRKGETDKLLETRSAELAQARAELAQAHISTAILGAAAEAVDPQTVLALLAGKAKHEHGVVTIDGKPAGDAVKALLTEKPFLAKAGSPGSGAPQSGAGAEKNPWAKGSFNLTEQIRISKEDSALAQKLKAQA